MTRFFRYLGLGTCTILLTVFLSASWGVMAVPTPGERLHTVPMVQATLPHLPLTQLSSDNFLDRLIEQGRQHYREGQYAEAIALWQQALSNLTAEGDRFERARVLSNLALAHRQLGQWDQANQQISESLSSLQPFDTLTGEGLRVLAQALNTQGNLSLAQGQSEAARASWEQATEVYQQVGDLHGVVRSRMNQAIALRVLGFHRHALQQLEQAQAQFKSFTDEHSDPALRVALLRSLGETQRLLGDLDSSYQSLMESLALADQLNLADEATLTHLSLGNTLWIWAQQQEALAVRTSDARIQSDAADRVQTALTEYQQVVEHSASPLLQVQAQLNQLAILIHRQAWSEAQLIAQRLPDQLAALTLSRDSVYATIQLAEQLSTLRQQGECSTFSCPSAQQILHLLTTAVQQAHRLNDAQAQSYALGSLGHLYEQQHQTSTALDLTDQALSLSQRYQLPEISYRWQWQLGRLYREQGDIQRALDAYDDAFHTVQAVRKDLLFLNPDIQFNFRDRIEPLYRAYVDLLLTDGSNETVDDQQTQATQARIAQDVIDDLRLAELENFLACRLTQADNSDARITIDDVANIDQRTAILYPIILSDRLEVLLKLPNQPILRYPSTRIDQATVEQTLDQLRHSLEQPYFSSNRGKPVAAQVYEWLVRPAEHHHWLDETQIDTLVFVLDGKFRNVPMAALYDAQGDQFLIEKYAIAVTFGDLELPQTPPAHRLRALIAGLSDPPNWSEFGPLTYVPVEILNIEQTLHRTKVLKNSEFTKAAIEAEINGFPYNVVHLATHGEFGFSREETFLLAAIPSDTQSDPPSAANLTVEKIDLNQLDQLLRARDYAPIELLVLSACETATGDDREVLGIAGMAIQAGARSTIATLWSIDDSSTAVLMKAFYEGLVNQQLSKAQALRQAQQQLIHNRAYKPSDWAPYLLVGDWR